MHANSLAEALAQPHEIRHLVLSGQALERIPPKVWKKLPNLESLDLSHNRIKKLPAGLAELSKLRSLQLSFNRITQVDEDFFALFPLLKHLDFRNNRLRQLQLISLSLESLDLSENKLKGLSPLQLHCPELLHLDLASNKLEEFRVGAENLSHLQYLNLGFNRLQKLPALPVSLYALVVNNNRLTSLPANLSELKRLQRLEVSYNPIVLNLPELAKNTQLSYLDVRHTPTNWPGAQALLLKLPQLRHLYGGLSRKLQDQLSGFLAELPPAMEASQRALCFRLWQGFAAGQVEAGSLWSCLNANLHPLIQLGAHYELLRKYPARDGQLLSRIWWLCGEMASDKTVIKNRLAAAGIRCTDKSAEATGVLLGHQFSTLHQQAGAVPVMEERQLVQWLDRKEQRYLTQTRDRVQLANLERMLRAPDQGAFQLGIQLLRSQGTPDELISTLLQRWLAASPAERASWEDVLLPYLPGSLNIALANQERMLTFPSRRGKAAAWWKMLS
ncbi:leucine-rich repeat domain-containing protein [Lewinella sp. LCG006]|uniref:leucine-rich repeat domain-containing protein n=1 Tax=Lewinella sp. LCG006 TaxID=3231911 RepID=UPI003460000F